jgi:hypothetical protein
MQGDHICSESKRYILSEKPSIALFSAKGASIGRMVAIRDSLMSPVCAVSMPLVRELIVIFFKDVSRIIFRLCNFE